VSDVIESPSTIEVEVNGELRAVGARATVRQLLAELELPFERIAVELNRELLPRDRFERPLAAGDRLEIVTFVGGG
jgi:thiamine biosynthesis protein ThiS